MRDPLPKDAAEVPLVYRNHPVQALAPNRANHPFAERVRLRRPQRRPENPQTHGRDGSIDAVGIDAVVIVDQESMRRVARDQHSELLCRPIRRGMFGHIPVPDPAGADFQHHEDVDDAERGRDRDEEIAGQDRAGVIPHERAPQLRLRAVGRRRTDGHVAPHRSRRH